ncbi:unnamed protein product [Rhizopus stolonifer]
MTSYCNVRIIHALTPKDFQKCLSVRYNVFIEEQKYSPEIENDGIDELCQHWLATCDKANEDGTVDHEYPIGTVRLIPKPDGSAKLGRLAVLSQARGLCAGKKLINAFIEYCKNSSHHTIVLHSQYDRRGFYEKIGFVLEENDSEVFTEANTPHVRMWMRNL